MGNSLVAKKMVTSGATLQQDKSIALTVSPSEGGIKVVLSHAKHQSIMHSSKRAFKRNPSQKVFTEGASSEAQINM